MTCHPDEMWATTPEGKRISPQVSDTTMATSRSPTRIPHPPKAAHVPPPTTSYLPTALSTLFQVLLMVRFGGVEGWCGRDLCGDSLADSLFLGFQTFPGLALLDLRVREDCASVLCTRKRRKHNGRTVAAVDASGPACFRRHTVPVCPRRRLDGSASLGREFPRKYSKGLLQPRHEPTGQRTSHAEGMRGSEDAPPNPPISHPHHHGSTHLDRTPHHRRTPAPQLQHAPLCQCTPLRKRDWVCGRRCSRPVSSTRLVQHARHPSTALGRRQHSDYCLPELHQTQPTQQYCTTHGMHVEVCTWHAHVRELDAPKASGGKRCLVHGSRHRARHRSIEDFTETWTNVLYRTVRHASNSAWHGQQRQCS